jgi:hypothetical protein
MISSPEPRRRARKAPFPLAACPHVDACLPAAPTAFRPVRYGSRCTGMAGFHLTFRGVRMHGCATDPNYAGYRFWYPTGWQPDVPARSLIMATCTDGGQVHARFIAGPPEVNVKPGEPLPTRAIAASASVSSDPPWLISIASAMPSDPRLGPSATSGNYGPLLPLLHGLRPAGPAWRHSLPALV